MWQVQVGKPKKEAWLPWEPPEYVKNYIGNPVTPQPEFATRREARALAKRISSQNRYWNYRVRQV